MQENNAASLTHMPLAMSARPARLALLVPELDEVPWPAMFEAALTAQTRVWGGVGNLPMPLTGELTENDVFWALSDIFDPDAFVTYAPALTEMEMLEPKYYSKTLEGYRENLSDGNEEALERFIADALEEVVFERQPSSEQLALIRKRLAPLPERLSTEQIERFNSTTKASWPFTDVAEFDQLPSELEIPVAPEGSLARRLLLSAVQGRVPKVVARELLKRGVAITERPLSRYAWSEQVRANRVSGAQRPWSLSEIGLGYFRTRPMIDAPAAIVVGESPWDFALYYALLRLTGQAWWLPSWLARDQSYVMTVAHAIQFDASSEGREVLVTSTSAAPRRVERVAQELAGLTRRGEPRVGSWQEALPGDPQRLAGLDSETRTKLVAVFEGRVLELDTPIPRAPSTTPPTYMRWVAEVRSPEWTPIRNSAIAERILPGLDGGSGMARTSREGLSYFPMGALVLGNASLEGTVLRPEMRPLGLEEQVSAILGPQGWRCQISDKGIYAREAMALFGGFDQLCEALRDRQIRSVLDAYLDPNGPGPMLSLDRRSYLTWQHFRELLGADEADTIRSLQDAGVLAQGVVLKCARCRQIAWHRSGLITDTFTCERCSSVQPANRRAWFEQDEPLISYRMAEVLFQLLTHNGELPLLAVNDQFGGSRRPRGHGFELDLWTPEGDKYEVDILRSDGSALWIGEASINGRFKEGKLEFLARLAEVLNAAGILLATSLTRWPDSTVAKARAVFGGAWPVLQMRDTVKINPLPEGEPTEDS